MLGKNFKDKSSRQEMQQLLLWGKNITHRPLNSSKNFLETADKNGLLLMESTVWK